MVVIGFTGIRGVVSLAVALALPLTLPDGSIGIKVPQLLRLQELASSRLPDVRVIPQMHKLLGAL